MKNHIHIFITAQLLITASLAYTMETIKPHTPKFIELTAVEQPHQALYLTNNTALVLHKNGCSIINTTKNMEIKKICDHPNTLFSSGIELHPNKTKMAFFYHTRQSEDPKIAIYDLATGKREWSKKRGPSVTCASFNPLDDTIGVCHSGCTKIPIYNYKTNENTYLNIETGDSNTLSPFTLR